MEVFKSKRPLDILQENRDDDRINFWEFSLSFHLKQESYPLLSLLWQLIVSSMNFTSLQVLQVSH